MPGMTAGDVGAHLEVSGLPLANKLRAALRCFGARMRGFVSEQAVLAAVESRTSAPVIR